VNETNNKDDLLRRIVPPLAAILLIVVFAKLGSWQLDRAAEKNDLAAMFEAAATHRTILGGEEVAPFELVEIQGHYLPEHQILIDNIVRDARVGYFVVTALEYDPDQPLLLINRGWLAKTNAARDGVDIAVASDVRTLRGRAGHLPRVGIRSGEPFAGGPDWPRVAVYPTLDDVAKQLDRDVLPYILWLDSAAQDGFVRNWMPRQAGPMMHYGYAFQWFALCLTVVAISVWQLRKKRSHR